MRAQLLRVVMWKMVDGNSRQGAVGPNAKYFWKGPYPPMDISTHQDVWQ